MNRIANPFRAAEEDAVEATAERRRSVDAALLANILLIILKGLFVGWNLLDCSVGRWLMYVLSAGSLRPSKKKKNKI